jgi:prepilin-type N-terminal cleavage/methylation domain-containing protein
MKLHCLSDRYPQRGFTLIELLVVIAIIAILASLLLPTLSKAKELATGVRCQANQKNLVLAWMSYADDNNGHLVDGGVGGGFWPGPQIPPGKLDWSISSKEEVLSWIHEGIKQGPLFEYNPSVDAYHCPGDLRMKHLELGEGWAFDSYSLAGGLITMGWGGGAGIDRYSMIINPSDKFVFVEEADNRGFNVGTWVLNPIKHMWVDPFAVWHNWKSTLSFADGHAETHKWLEETTIKASELGPENPRFWAKARNDRDFEYVEPRFMWEGSIR